MHARLIHRFNYSYSQPVLLGPHRFCLRPRPHGFQRLIDFKLAVSPEPSQLYELMAAGGDTICLLYTSPSPRDRQKSRMPSSA